MARRPVVSNDPPAGPENLYIAITQRIVGRHHNQLRMPLKTVQFVLERAAKDAGTSMESKDGAHMREHLERETGISIRELAEISKRWPT